MWCAEQVLDIYEKEYPDDRRVRECLEGIRKYQRGEISKEDLAILIRADADAADNAADAAVYAAADAAADAAVYAADAAVYAADAAAADAYVYAAAYAADAAVYADDAAYDIRSKQKAKFIEMLNEHEEK